MNTASEFTRFARLSPVYLGALLFFWGVFGFFTLSQLLRQDSAAADPDKLKELQKVVLAPDRSIRRLTMLSGLTP